MAPRLYWREFTRNKPGDIDHVADQAFLSTNFVDFFGKWLQQGDNAGKSSLDALLKVFWSNHVLLFSPI
jgi:hypothetical protein